MADVGQPQIAGFPVEGKSPRITKSVGPNLGAGFWNAGEGIILGDSVTWGLAGVIGNVDTEEGTQEGAQVLAVGMGVAAAAAIAQSQVKVAVGAEGQLAAVVVAKGLGDFQQYCFTGGVGLKQGIRADGKAGQDRPAGVGGGVVYEEAAIFGVGRRESQPQQPLLVALDADAVSDVQKDGSGGGGGVVGKGGDYAVLFGYEEMTGSIGGLGQPGKALETQGGEGKGNGQGLQRGWPFDRLRANG